MWTAERNRKALQYKIIVQSIAGRAWEAEPSSSR